jgi:cytochrome P450
MSASTHPAETAERSSDPMLSDAFHADPATVLAELRQSDPVHLIPELGAWVITRYDDVRRLFTDPNVDNDPRCYENYVAPPEDSPRHWIAENSLFSVGPKQHARQRRLVSAALKPRAVARMEVQVRAVIEQYAAPLRKRTGVVDLVGEFTGPIPNTVISRITGIPAKGGDERRFRDLAQTVLRGINPFLGEDERQQADDAIVEMCAYVRELAVTRRRDPREDLISDLVLAHDEADSMTNDEIVLMITALVSAGSETTSIGGTTGIQALLKHPDQMDLLREDPKLLPNAVDELLRYDFGSASLPRYAIRDFTLRGKQIKRGQLLMLSLLGAHRDPAVFPDPDRLDVTRDTSSLTIFGHGPHYCLGVNLARQELRCMIEAALDFLPAGASVVDDQIERTRMGMFSRIDVLPVDFGG